MDPATTDLLSPAELSRALQVAERLAVDAAEVISATSGRQARPGTKSNAFDWVTETDRTVERHTRRVLAAEFPGLAVLGEEYGSTAAGPVRLPGYAGGPELMWIVDPVDGTSNYVAGLPWCCYSLALVDASGPLVGVIADPYQGQLYAAARGRGLRANGLRVPPAGSWSPDGLAGSLIMIEPARPGTLPEPGHLLSAARMRHAGVRVMGSSALAVAQVALGRAAAAVLPEQGYQVWDVAGAIGLAAEAGLAITDLAGRPDGLPLDGLVVAVPSVLAEVLELVVPPGRRD